MVWIRGLEGEPQVLRLRCASLRMTPLSGPYDPYRDDVLSWSLDGGCLLFPQPSPSPLLVFEGLDGIEACCAIGGQSTEEDSDHNRGSEGDDGGPWRHRDLERREQAYR